MNIRAKLSQKGFTLIELLVVIGILAILLAVTLIAINPTRQFQQARDIQRKSDVTAILNAVHQFMIDNNGDLPLDVDGTSKEIAAPGGVSSADLCFQLVTRYIAALPVDPSLNSEPISPCSGAYTTGYYIISGADNRVTVSAPSAEGSSPIEVSR